MIDSKKNLLRRIERYKRRIDILKINRKVLIVAMQAEQRKLRTHYGNVVAEKLRDIRVLNDTVSKQTAKILEDTFKIQELDNQVAVQWKDNAGLGQDVRQLTKRYNENAQSTIVMHNHLRDADDVIKKHENTIADLRQRISYRIWVATATQATAIRQGIATRLATLRDRIVNRWMIHRLNKHRVQALNEAGHIPQKLVKTALAYYEHDKKRMARDEQVEVISYDRNTATVAITKRPSLWRRLQIWAGRA